MVNSILILKTRTLTNTGAKIEPTRKSSCVNARGIPIAAYQVLHMLSCPGGGGGLGTLGYALPPPNPQSWPGLGGVVGAWPGGGRCPLPPVDRLKTLPSPILRMRSVTKISPDMWTADHPEVVHLWLLLRVHSDMVQPSVIQLSWVFCYSVWPEY